jgi:hypothetical protein
MAAVLRRGGIRPTALPFLGQMAPKMSVEAVRWSLCAGGGYPAEAGDG